MTPAQLADAVGCSITTAVQWAYPLTQACRRYDVHRVPEFVAQCAHESMRFQHTEESLNYRSAERIVAVWPSRFTLETARRYVGKPEALANKVYAHRMGNGDEASGDGWRFRGRGLLQLSGRTNFERFEAATGLPVTKHQAILMMPVFAAESAAWYWSDRNLDKAIDVEAITRAINGGTIGLQDRVELTERAQRALA